MIKVKVTYKKNGVRYWGVREIPRFHRQYVEIVMLKDGVGRSDILDFEQTSFDDLPVKRPSFPQPRPRGHLLRD